MRRFHAAPLACVSACVAGSLIGSPALAKPSELAYDFRIDSIQGGYYLSFMAPDPDAVVIGHDRNELVIKVPNARRLATHQRRDRVEVALSALTQASVRSVLARYDAHLPGLCLVFKSPVFLRARRIYVVGRKRVHIAVTTTHQLLAAAPIAQPPKAIAAPPKVEAPQPPSPAPYVPTVLASPSAPAMPTTPLPKSGDWSFGYPDVRTSFGVMSERYAPQDVQGRADATLRLSSTWVPRWKDVAFPISLSRGGYVLDDSDYPGVTHTRTETGVSAGATFPHSLGSLSGRYGYGYQATLTQATSNALTPSQPAPSTFLFANYQWLHGPFVSESLEGQLVGPLGWNVGLEWSPVLLAATDGGPPMAYLTELRAAPSIAWHSARLGAYYDRMLGPAFDRQAEGAWAGIDF